MKIQKIDFLPRYNAPLNPNENNKSNTLPRIKTYNPPAYKDFSPAFAGRLWRSPENFYGCDFNQKNMPATMKEYLDEDFEDRQKMPPAQMLTLVFADVKNAKSLKEVKELYPDEPLFANLTDIPNQKSKTGTLAYIDMFKEDGKSLFKNGQDNLGLYLVKKIYTEGKTLKEINKDFNKDISVHYAGLPEPDYKELHKFGIRFPNHSFWSSLTATREEFPYEYKPRKAAVSRVAESESRKSSTPVASAKPAQKGKFDNVKDWEIEKLTEALVKGNGSKSETEKQMKKRNIQNKDSLNFVAKYMGEINAVVIDKLHISEDMREYFENYEDLTKSQREKFESYMKDPYMNELRSKVMSSTIRLFFDVYGVDGNNEDFKELLDYSRNLKNQRLEQQAKHDALQAEYEEKLGIFDSSEMEKEEDNYEDDDVEEALILAKYKKLLDEANVKFFDFEAGEDKITIVGNLQEALSEKLTADTKMMPTPFANNFIKFVLTRDYITDDYILTTLLKDKNINLPQDERLMPQDKAEDITLSLYQDYTEAAPQECRAAQQAIINAYIELTDKSVSPHLFRFGVFEFTDLFREMGDYAKAQYLNKANLINRKFADYKRPLSDAEARKAALQVMDLLRKYNPSDTIVVKPTPFEGCNDIFYGLTLMIKSDNKSKENLKNDLISYIKDYGGSARFLLDKNIPDKYKMAKMEQILCCFTYDRPGVLPTYVALNKNSMEYLQKNNFEIYNLLRKELMF